MQSSSASSDINGGKIKFKNRWCHCRRKAGIRISESTKNPSKLYFFCLQGKCNYYSFWTPDNEEFNIDDDDASSEKMQLPSNEASEMHLQSEIKALERRMNNVETMQSSMKVMMFLFGMLVVGFAFAMKNM